MGGDIAPLGQTQIEPCFNPRPRMGGDTIRINVTTGSCVSIHAPVWGATVAPTVLVMH